MHCGIQEPFLPALLDARRNARSSVAQLHRAPLRQSGSRKNSSFGKAKCGNITCCLHVLWKMSTAFSAPQNAPKLCCRTLIAKLRVKKLRFIILREDASYRVWSGLLQYDTMGWELGEIEVEIEKTTRQAEHSRTPPCHRNAHTSRHYEKSKKYRKYFCASFRQRESNNV